jgi:cysteine desulfurase
MAMRVPDDRLRSSVRFSLGATTTETEIDEAVARIAAVVERTLETQDELENRGVARPIENS